MIKREDNSAPGHGESTLAHFYEAPNNDLNLLQVWCYTDKLSYAAGDSVKLHISTTATTVDVTVFRDGAKAEAIITSALTQVKHYPTPDNFYRVGCGWPVAHSFKLPDEISSGFYLVKCKASDNQGNSIDHAAGFFVRPSATSHNTLLLVAATSTWSAYNDWGGTNNYSGLDKELPAGKSPKLSIHRPWARGFLALPQGAPRKPHTETPAAGDLPRYPPIEFAYSRGFSKYYANAGWASYERVFVNWAEEAGYTLDIISQTDLHITPDIINNYSCIVTVGHDEYWSDEMRHAVDNFVNAGGNFARFGGNFCWQIRLEDGGDTQVCYKEEAAEFDPVINTDQQHRLTSFWEDPLVGWSGAQTVGLNGLYGIYARVGNIAPRHSGGFTVYRPDHWAFANTQLCYGDELGSEALIFGYEVDGLDYVTRHGIPEPTYQDGAIEGTQILAMGLAGNIETETPHTECITYYADVADLIARCRYGVVNEKTKADARRGSGMIVYCRKGKGQIFNAGSSEWVAGLLRKDTATEQVTINVLEKFMAHHGSNNE